MQLFSDCYDHVSAAVLLSCFVIDTVSEIMSVGRRSRYVNKMLCSWMLETATPPGTPIKFGEFFAGKIL